jgi:hypothetical protein
MRLAPRRLHSLPIDLYLRQREMISDQSKTVLTRRGGYAAAPISRC